MNKILKIFRCFYHFFLFFIDSFFSFNNKSPRNNTFTIVRLDAIGDFIIYISSANLIPEKYIGMKKILICNQAVFELANSLKIFDEIIGINLPKFKKNLIYRFQIIKKIMATKSKIAIQPTFSRHFSTGDAIIRVSGANMKIGFDGDYTNQSKFFKLISDKWYSKLIRSDKLIKMERDRNHEFLEKISNKKVKFKEYILPKLVDLNSKIFPPKRYIVICPGASSEDKCWPKERYKKLVKEIMNNFEIKIIICGSKKEKGLIKDIMLDFESDFLKDIYGKSLLEFIEILRNALFIIGNDSSSVHIASLVKTKSICIYGGKLYKRFIPYPKDQKYAPIPVFDIECKKNNWSCSQDHNCLSKIEVQDIMKIVKSELKI